MKSPCFQVWLVVCVLSLGCSRFEPIESNEPDVAIDIVEDSSLNLCAGVTCASDALPSCYFATCDITTGECIYQKRANGTSCVDDEPCTMDTRCEDGLCVGTAVQCVDAGPCQRGVCQPGVGCTAEAVEDGEICEDGNACTHFEVCVAGDCQASSETVCSQDDCPQILMANFDCQECRCNTVEGTCMAYVVNSEGPCNADDDGCTVNDVCSDEGICQSGLSPVCDDGVECTSDACVSTGTNTYICDAQYDGSGCDLGGVNCVSVGAVNPANDCEQCAPDESPNSWSWLEAGSACSDGDGCSSGESCFEGQCSVGEPMVCTNELGCTATTCVADSDTTGHCQTVILPDRCLIEQLCVVGGAIHPFNECQGCFPDVDATAWTPVPAGTSCNADDDGCTVGDACNPLGACESGINGSIACDDEVSCTIDICKALSVTSHECENITQVGCMIDGECFGSNTPNPETPCQICAPVSSTTQWSNVPPWAGVACDADGDGCTVLDQCVNGECVPGNPKDCGDGLGCTVDTCESTGVDSNQCVHSIQANWCAVEMMCIPNGSANPANSCLFCDATLNPKQWAVLTPGTVCSDDSVCTELNQCQNAACEGQAVDCNDDNLCTDDQCDAVKGCLNEPNDNGCDDGVACTVGDGCQAGQCISGVLTNCPCLTINRARVLGGHCIQTSKSVPLLQNGGFTVEFWLRTTGAADGVVVSKQMSPQVGGDPDWAIRQVGGDAVFSYGVDGQPDGTFTTTVGTLNDGLWHHVALSRNAESVMTWWVDGESVAVQTVQDNMLFGNTATLSLGCTATGANVWTGDLDEVRISDFARYQEPFGLPGRHVVDIATRALWHLDETAQTLILEDGSGNGFDAVSANGAGQTTGDVVDSLAVCCGNGALEPGEACDDLNATLGDGCGYQCDLEGGLSSQSGIFDGTKTCLHVPSSELAVNSSDLTIEFWIKTTGTSDTADLVLWVTSFGVGQQSAALRLGNTGALVYHLGSFNLFETNAKVDDDQWHHAALSCESLDKWQFSCRWLIDGKLDSQALVAFGVFGDPTAEVFVGCNGSSGEKFNGRLDEIRWSSKNIYIQVPFTPSTTLSPADETEFLFNFDQPLVNGRVVDLSAHQLDADVTEPGSLSFSSDSP